jgi:glutathione S-transferase
MRATLDAQPFLGGEAPHYADYACFGGFQWARTTSRFTLLEDGDPVAQWRARMLGLFDGLAGKAKGYAC